VEHIPTFPSRTPKSVSKHESKRMKKCITPYGELFNGKKLKFCNFSIVIGSAEI
jgi:hypothetical protein